jgi:hypothetical protein
VTVDVVPRVPTVTPPQTGTTPGTGAGTTNTGAGTTNTGAGTSNTGAGTANTGAGTTNTGTGMTNTGTGTTGTGTGTINTGAGTANTGAGTATTGTDGAAQAPTRDAPGPSGNRPVGAAAQQLLDFVNVFDSISLADSTPDRINRATDIYNGYIVAHLKRAQDARVTHGLMTTPSGGNAPADANKPRELMMLFQTHVHPGSRPDHMTGVRLQIVSVRIGGKEDSSKTALEKAAVYRLHPSRTYDLEAARFSESLAELAIVRASLSGNVQSANIAVVPCARCRSGLRRADAS